LHLSLQEIENKKGIGGIAISQEEAFQKGLDLFKHKRYEKKALTFLNTKGTKKLSTYSTKF